MITLLDLAYLAALAGTSPWLAYQALRKGKYREGWLAKCFGHVPRRSSKAPCLWFHAVSVGEVNLLGTLIDQLARRRPEWQCVVSTTTMTGMGLARKKFPQLATFYCPLDFSWAVRRAFRRVCPAALVLVELELWPNLVRIARQAGVAVAVVNGRLSDRSFRGYRRIRPLVARLLGELDVIAVQNQTYAERFLQLGARPETVRVTGNMKFDGAQTDRANPATERLRRLAGLRPDDIVFLAGSTQEPEEAMALATYRQLAGGWPALRLILVPRHPDRFPTVARMLDQSGLAWQRRSRLEKDGPNPAARVLLVDAVGELAAWWGTAQIAFVGGSLGNRGGQNMIEPAAYGAAVSFGPNTSNFRDVVALLLESQAAVVVHEADEMTGFVRRCLAVPGFAQTLGQRARQLVRSQLGATRRTVELLLPLVATPSRSPVPPPHFAPGSPRHRTAETDRQGAA